MDILSYILGKKNSGSNTGGSGGTGGSGSSNASVFVKGGGTVVDPTQNYSRLYFNTKLSNEEVMALMNNLELNFQGTMNMLYITDRFDMIVAMVGADDGVYALSSESSGILFAINGNLIDESITFTGWNPDIDFSNGIEIIGNTTIGTELPIEGGGSILIGANNDKIVNLFSSEPIKKSVNKGLSGVYDGANLEVGSTHIDVSSLLDENKLPLNIDVVDNNLIPRNIVEGVSILGVEGTYSAHGLENELVDRTLTTYTNNRVTSVGEYVFYNHKNLTTANFSNATNIGQYAFFNCANLISANFSNATNIGDSAFSKCFKLTSIDFPKATDIGQYAFQDCTSLTDIDFPEAINIGQHAFHYCSLLTNANFPKVTHIYLSAFTECSKLTSINFSNAVSIGDNAFNGCYSLTSIDLPKATSIEQYAFYGCKGVTNLNIPEVTNIGHHAFGNCSGLTEVYLPKANYIYNAAFIGCDNLTSINAPLVTELKIAAFQNCPRLADVNLPLLTHTEDSVFSRCPNLTSVVFPNVINIGSYTFQNCTGLNSVDAPKATYIGDYAFVNCGSLININAPLLNSVRSSSFQQCTSLTNVSFPLATFIEINGFYNCDNLTSVNVPLVTRIKPKSFVNCYSLIKLFISQSDKVCSLSNTDAFNNCFHILGTTDATYNPEGLKDGYIYVPASLLSQYKVATNWSSFASQIIGHEDLEAGTSLPDYTTTDFTTQTWYSDERLTTVVTEVATTGKYYCRLEA